MSNKLKIKESLAGYSGQVKITLINSGVKYKTIEAHNQGTSDFFEYIFNCICGQPNYELRPGYLYLYNYDSSTESETQLINFGILYEGDTVITSGNDLSGNPYANLTYRFMIPSTIIKNKSINRLKLKSLSKQSGDYITYAILDLTSSILVETDTNLEVDWTLKLTNE